MESKKIDNNQFDLLAQREQSFTEIKRLKNLISSEFDEDDHEVHPDDFEITNAVFGLRIFREDLVTNY